MSVFFLFIFLNAVPISYIASTKKIKALSSNHQLVALALRSSSKLVGLFLSSLYRVTYQVIIRLICEQIKVVSEDSKKVKRKSTFTDRDREELQVNLNILKALITTIFISTIYQFHFLFLQGRTVVAENLPDDHSYQNLEKIFGVVGK